MLKFVLFVLFLVFLMAQNCSGTAFDDLPILRIVGGYKVEITDYPHSVFLQTSAYICGGSILTSRAILSAAHCFPMHNDSLRMRTVLAIAMIGATNPYLASQKIPIIKAVTHELYEDEHNSNENEYDISIVFTKAPIKFSDSVKKVVLPTKSYGSETIAKTAGWGQTTIYNQLPYYKKSKEKLELKAIEQRIIKQKDCNNIFFNYKSEHMLCLGDHRGIDQPYRGDSGSALVVDGYIQIGIVSFGTPTVTSITVYTDIIPFLSWIEREVLEFTKTHCL